VVSDRPSNFGVNVIPSLSRFSTTNSFDILPANCQRQPKALTYDRRRYREMSSLTLRAWLLFDRGTGFFLHFDPSEGFFDCRVSCTGSIYSTNQTLQRRHNAIMVQAQNTMRRIGLDLINEKRHAITTEKEKSDPGTFDGAETSHDRDLLSLLSNLLYL
jgi:hypothetical protein